MAAPQRPNIQSIPAVILVKLREPLGSEILAALPPGTLTLTPMTPANDHAKDFLTRHSVSALRPLFPGFARARLVNGLTEAQVIAQVRDRFPARSRRIARVLPAGGLDRIYVLSSNGALTQLPDLVARLSADPEVEYAELDHSYSVEINEPNDPYLSSYSSWGQSYADLWGIDYIGAPAAWATSTGSGITVAVIDTGIDLKHPDIVANLWTNPGETPTSTTDLDGDGYAGDYYGWDFAYSNNDPTDHIGHGTHVAGTIAATANNGIGVAGVAYAARVMAVKGLDDDGYGLDTTLAPALVYAANRGADVFNLSWGGYGTSQVISDAVDYAYGLGVVVVAAAGNSSIDATGFTPANLPHVITVAAIDSTGTRANFSDFGPKIDVAAPGVDILSLQASGTTLGAVVSPGYMRLSGTSMATPHVAGLAALLLAAHPEYTNEEVRQALRVSASSAAAFNSDTGYGVVQSVQALAVSLPLEAHIASPLNGFASSATITISGVARGSGFASYSLAYGLGAAPTSWTTFTTSASPVSGGVLGTLDTSALANGTWVVRLTVLNTLGAAFVDQVQFTAITAAIITPAPPRALSSANSFKPGGLMSITGTAVGSGFQSYKLEWAPGAAPDTGWQTGGITLSGGGTATVSSGVLGTWDTSALNTAGYYSLRLTVYRASSTDTAVTVVYSQPGLAPGAWPVWLSRAPSGGAVQFCSAGTSACQLVMSSSGLGTTPGALWVMSMDGTVNQYQFPLPGHGSVHQPSVAGLSGAGDQIVVADYDRLRVYTAGGQNTEIVPDRSLDMAAVSTPIADLSGNGTWTTFAFGTDWNTNLGYVYAWTGTGTPAGSNFPITIQDQNPINGWTNRVRVIAADVDGDGEKEIIVSEGLSPTTFTLRLYSSDGTPRTWAVPQLSGLPQSMAAADLDGNGKNEVVVVAYDTDFMTNGGYATIHVFQPDGSERTGWPQQFPIDRQSMQSYLAIGDLAQNGRKEIVWASTMLCVLNADGTSYSPAWPKVQVADPEAAQGSYGAIVLGDVDGDGKPEIVTTSDSVAPNSNPYFPYPQFYDQTLVAFHLDGTMVRSWQLTGLNGYDLYTNGAPSIGDFGGQGSTEIAVVYPVTGPGGLAPGVVAIFETGVPFNAALNPWPYAFSNRQNNPVLAVQKPVNACDINGDGAVNVADVQLIIDEALGVNPAINDLNGDGVVNVADVQIVINAALGLACAAK